MEATQDLVAAKVQQIGAPNPHCTAKVEQIVVSRQVIRSVVRIRMGQLGPLTEMMLGNLAAPLIGKLATSILCQHCRGSDPKQLVPPANHLVAKKRRGRKSVTPPEGNQYIDQQTIEKLMCSQL